MHGNTRTDCIRQLISVPSSCGSRRVRSASSRAAVAKSAPTRCVQDCPRRVDHHPEAVGACARRDRGFDVAALSTDPGHEDRHVADDRADGAELVGERRADDEPAFAELAPLQCRTMCDVGEQRLTLHVEGLEVVAASVRCAAQHEHAVLGVLEVRLDRIGAEVRVDRDCVGAVAVECFARVLLVLSVRCRRAWRRGSTPHEGRCRGCSGRFVRARARLVAPRSRRTVA